MSGMGPSSGLMVGAIVPFPGAAAPSGWLLCGGQAVSRTVYAGLFTAISTTYGAGDGSTTFNLPDLRGRVPAGVDNMGGSAANRITSGGAGIVGTTLGASGGTETHTLTTAQLAVHSHSLSVNSIDAGVTSSTYGSNQIGTPLTTGNAGSGNAHQNTQPTLVLNYIIKV